MENDKKNKYPPSTHSENNLKSNTQSTPIPHSENNLKSNTQSTPIPHSENNLKRKNYYTTSEVAKILGVDKSTVRKWRNKGLFDKDLIDHKGQYLYSREHVEQLKSVYHKDWTSGGYSERIEESRNIKEDWIFFVNWELSI